MKDDRTASMRCIPGYRDCACRAFAFVVVFYLALVVVASANGQSLERLKPLDVLPNLDKSEVSTLVDLQSWNGRSAVLLKLLNRLPVVPAYLYEQVEIAGLKEFEHRISNRNLPQLERFRIRGSVLSLARISLSEKEKERYEFSNYWRMDVKPDNAGGIIRAIVRDVPRAWLDASKQLLPEVVGQSVLVDGLMVYDYADRDDEKTVTAVFACPRIQWFPNESFPGVSSGQFLLGQHGVDIGGFDLVRATDGRRLDYKDSEAFFQMLRACREIEKESLDPEGYPDVDIFDFFRERRAHYGNGFRIRGRLRRITPIDVDPTKYGNRFEMDRYYQLDVFVKLDKGFDLKNSKGEKIRYENDFPISICVASLPPELQDQKQPSVDVELTAFYFKMWQHHSSKSRKAGDMQQVAPLMVGLEPKIVEFDPQSELDWIFGTLFGVLFVAILLGGGFLFFAKQRPARREQEPDKIELPS